MHERTHFARRMACPRPRIAFYYGNGASLEGLHDFDVAVVEPGFHRPLPDPGASHTRWLAYVSLGEVLSSRPYFEALPENWLLSGNSVWGGGLIDQSATGWPEFLVKQVTDPLHYAGYGGFFLDTADAYLQLGPELRPAQQAGAAESILRLRQAYPDAVIILNRGFELLPEVHAHIDAIAFESLYGGWDEARRRYVSVSPEDRLWLLARSATAQSYGLPVIAIDYCPPQDRTRARTIADRIRGHHIVPHVSDGHLLTIPVSDEAPHPPLAAGRTAA